jgi:hypothetical protein
MASLLRRTKAAFPPRTAFQLNADANPSAFFYARGRTEKVERVSLFTENTRGNSGEIPLKKGISAFGLLDSRLRGNFYDLPACKAFLP